MTAVPAGPGGLVRLVAPVAGITALAIFLQAVTAGEFVSQDHRDGWITVHGIIGNAVVLLALATAVVTLIALRRTAPVLVGAAIGLFVLVVVQTVIGHLITEGKQDGWIALHVPLAFIIFGLTVWLPVGAARVRRAAVR